MGCYTCDFVGAARFRCGTLDEWVPKCGNYDRVVGPRMRIRKNTSRFRQISDNLVVVMNEMKEDETLVGAPHDGQRDEAYEEIKKAIQKARLAQG